MKYTIIDKPNFKYEAVSCITQYYTDHEKELMENYQHFNFTEEEMKNFLKNYSMYKKTVTEEVLPIYNSYPKLQKIFKIEVSDEIYKSSIILPLSIDFQDVVFDPNNLSLIDEKLNHFLETYIQSISEDYNDSNLKINGFEDLLKALNDIKIDNSEKMIFIDLYYNRYELIKDFLDFVNIASKVCENHFNLIEDDFNATYKYLSELNNIEEPLSKMVGVHFNIPKDSKLYISIFDLNIFSLFGLNSMILGIYFFQLASLREKNKYNFSDLSSELKVLADPTRLKIINLLSKQSLYTQEMAEILELTPATISHHISILLKYEFVSIHIDTEQSKKIFYRTNPVKLNSLGDVIKDLSNLN